jgi:hypothetical protein
MPSGTAGHAWSESVKLECKTGPHDVQNAPYWPGPSGSALLAAQPYCQGTDGISQCRGLEFWWRGAGVAMFGARIAALTNPIIGKKAGASY